MNLTDISSWLDSLNTPMRYAELLHSGDAVDVTSAAALSTPRRARLAVQAKVHERFVSWDSQAMREHGMAIEEQARLEALVEASAPARCAGAGCFVCKAVDCRGSTGASERVVLLLTNYGSKQEPQWLIHS